jgi:ankyrin repeat protein
MPIAQSTPDSITTATSEDIPENLFGCLISSINKNDLQLLHAALDAVVRQSLTGTCTSSPLNQLDEEFGFAPIHFAMLCRPPNFAIVNALFQAGADVNLLTLTLKSPLQILAEYARPVNSEDRHTLGLFARHLIRDLGASVRYRDNQMETVLHLAAEHGRCRELLGALVECNADAVVREWKNKRK